MVKREVVQLITPGTVMDSKGLSAKDNNFLTAVMKTTQGYSFAYADLSTGELKTALLEDEDAVLNEAAAYKPRKSFCAAKFLTPLKNC